MHICWQQPPFRETGNWLTVLPVSTLGLQRGNEVVCITVGSCLSPQLCEPHHCQHCGVEVVCTGSHRLIQQGLPFLTCSHQQGDQAFPEHHRHPLPPGTLNAMGVSYASRMAHDLKSLTRPYQINLLFFGSAGGSFQLNNSLH